MLSMRPRLHERGLRQTAPPFIAAALCALVIAACGSSRESASGRRGTPVRIHSSNPLRNRLVDEALRYEGTPYRYHGDTEKGMDCSGLVSTSFSAIGRKIPRTASEQYRAGTPIHEKDLIAGDLVFFRNTAGPGITHVGIYLDDGWFIHSSTSRGVIRSRLDDTYYSRHYAGSRRYLPP